MCCQNFLKVHKNTGEKIFNKYLSEDGCFVKTSTINCDDNDNAMFSNTNNIEYEPAYCPDRYELLQISRPCKNSHCFQKVVQLFNLMRDYFPIRDSKRLECVKKCF